MPGLDAFVQGVLAEDGVRGKKKRPSMDEFMGQTLGGAGADAAPALSNIAPPSEMVYNPQTDIANRPLELPEGMPGAPTFRQPGILERAARGAAMLGTDIVGGLRQGAAGVVNWAKPSTMETEHLAWLRDLPEDTLQEALRSGQIPWQDTRYALLPPDARKEALDRAIQFRNAIAEGVGSIADAISPEPSPEKAARQYVPSAPQDPVRQAVQGIAGAVPGAAAMIGASAMGVPSPAIIAANAVAAQNAANEAVYNARMAGGAEHPEAYRAATGASQVPQMATNLATTLAMLGAGRVLPMALGGNMSPYVTQGLRTAAQMGAAAAGDAANSAIQDVRSGQDVDLSAAGAAGLQGLLQAGLFGLYNTALDWKTLQGLQGTHRQINETVRKINTAMEDLGLPKVNRQYGVNDASSMLSNSMRVGLLTPDRVFEALTKAGFDPAEVGALVRRGAPAQQGAPALHGAALPEQGGVPPVPAPTGQGGSGAAYAQQVMPAPAPAGQLEQVLSAVRGVDGQNARIVDLMRSSAGQPVQLPMLPSSVVGGDVAPEVAEQLSGFSGQLGPTPAKATEPSVTEYEVDFSTPDLLGAKETAKPLELTSNNDSQLETERSNAFGLKADEAVSPTSETSPTPSGPVSATSPSSVTLSPSGESVKAETPATQSEAEMRGPKGKEAEPFHANISIPARSKTHHFVAEQSRNPYSHEINILRRDDYTDSKGRSRVKFVNVGFYSPLTGEFSGNVAKGSDKTVLGKLRAQVLEQLRGAQPAEAETQEPPEPHAPSSIPAGARLKNGTLVLEGINRLSGTYRVRANNTEGRLYFTKGMGGEPSGYYDLPSDSFTFLDTMDENDSILEGQFRKNAALFYEMPRAPKPPAPKPEIPDDATLRGGTLQVKTKNGTVEFLARPFERGSKRALMLGRMKETARGPEFSPDAYYSADDKSFILREGATGPGIRGLETAFRKNIRDFYAEGAPRGLLPVVPETPPTQPEPEASAPDVAEPPRPEQMRQQPEQPSAATQGAPQGIPADAKLRRGEMTVRYNAKDVSVEVSPWGMDEGEGAGIVSGFPEATRDSLYREVLKSDQESDFKKSRESAKSVMDRIRELAGEKTPDLEMMRDSRSVRQSEDYDPGDPKTWPEGPARDEALALEAWQNLETNEGIETWPESPEKTEALVLEKEYDKIAAWIENLSSEEFTRRLQNDDPEFTQKNERGVEIEERFHALRRSLSKKKPKNIEKRLSQLIEAEIDAAQEEALAAQEAENARIDAEDAEEYYHERPAVNENIRRGRAAMEKVIAEHTDVMDAMYRDDLGSISFLWGEPGRGPKFKGGAGVSHIIAHRNAQGYDGETVARKMVEVIAKGKVDRRYGAEVPGGERANIVYDGYTAALSLYKDGNRKTWLLTGWEDYKEKSPGAPSEGDGSTGATLSEPMRTRPEEGAGASDTSKPQPGGKSKTERAEAKKEPVSVMDVTRKVRNLFPLRHGLGSVPPGKRRNILGVFGRKSEVLRTKYRNNLPIIMHELGHALDKELKLRTRIPEEALTELLRAGAPVSGEDYTPNQIANEGIAEFVKAYTISRKEGREEFPKFTPVFEKALREKPDVLKNFEEVRKTLEAYYKQDAKDRILDKGPNTREWSPATLKEKIKQLGHDFYTAWVDSNHELYRVSERVRETLGLGILPDELNLYAAAQNSAGYMAAADQSAGRLLGIIKEYKMAPGDRADLEAYMKAARALDYRSNGLLPGLGTTEAEERDIVENQTPKHIREVAQRLHNVYEGIVQETLVDTGLMAQKTSICSRRNGPITSRLSVPTARRIPKRTSRSSCADVRDL